MREVKGDENEFQAQRRAELPLCFRSSFDEAG